MKRILIIGGTRFLGPVLIKNLEREDNEITIFNRGNNYNNVLPNRVIRIKGDRRVPSAMRVLSQKKYDLVYDLCCFNRNDALNLLRNIQPVAHIVFLSSAAVYKEPLIYPLREDSQVGKWGSFGDYGVQKAEAEKEFEFYAKKHNLKLTVFRPVYLLGKNNYFDRENYYFSRIINEDPILIPGTGRALIQFAFLDETAHVFKKIPENQERQIEILNISGNEYISVKNFVLMCGNIVKKEPIVIPLDTKLFNLNEQHFYDNFYPFPSLNFIASNFKIKTKYGINFKPLTEGLREIYIDWKKSWNGETKKYPLELAILKKIDK